MDKVVGMSEETLGELIDDSLKWMDAAQVLAYLIGGVNGAGADETLRIGRARLAKLFEDMYHDVACWREIANRQDASEYIRTFANSRAESLKQIADRAYQRFETRQEGKA